jgi:hypothetical protein
MVVKSWDVGCCRMVDRVVVATSVDGYAWRKKGCVKEMCVGERS